MRIIGTAVVAIIAVHAAHTFQRHNHALRERHAAAPAHPVAICSGPATAIAIGVLWPATAIAPISTVIGHWHYTLDAAGY